VWTKLFQYLFTALRKQRLGL